MYIEVLKSKLHCVKVTEANLNYMGSITIDEDLMDAAGLIAGEKVEVVNNNNGERLETYIIKGERGSGCSMVRQHASVLLATFSLSSVTPLWILRKPRRSSPKWYSLKRATDFDKYK